LKRSATDLAERYRLARLVRQSAISGGPWRMSTMLEQDSEPKAHCGFAASSALEMSLSQTHDPQEGARLVRAFLRIADPGVRSAIVHMVEKMESAPADC
jgi:hypothetical protein